MSRVYLDDLREAPAGWILTKTAPETITLLAAGGVTHLSLDHDLGEEPSVGNGYDVLTWLEEQVALLDFVPPEHIDVHSSNAGARPKMEAAIGVIRRLVRENVDPPAPLDGGIRLDYLLEVVLSASEVRGAVVPIADIEAAFPVELRRGVEGALTILQHQGSVERLPGGVRLAQALAALLDGEDG